jgi:hypothetical protein
MWLILPVLGECMKSLRGFPMVVLGLFLAAGQAVSQEYLCTMKSVSRDGFVDKAILFDIRGDDRALVFDRLVNHLHKGAIETDVKKLGEGRYRLKWTLTGLPTSNSQKAGPVRYSAMIDTAKGTVSVRVIMTSGDNAPWGSGKCTRTKR